MHATPSIFKIFNYFDAWLASVWPSGYASSLGKFTLFTIRLEVKFRSPDLKVYLFQSLYTFPSMPHKEERGGWGRGNDYFCQQQQMENYHGVWP